MEAVDNYLLKRHAVRIRRSNTTIGSGFLIAPPDSSNAFVLTAAHVLHGDNSNLNIQFLEVPHEQSRYIPTEVCWLHSGYDHSKACTMVQYCDAALIRIDKEPWMNNLPHVYLGVPHDKMDIIAVGFAAVNTDPSPAHGNVFHDTHINIYTPEDHRISATVRGEFILNHADLDSEMEGMSGTFFAAKGQEAIILVGILSGTTGENAVYGQMNLVDPTGIMELLLKYDIRLEQKAIRAMPTPGAREEQRPSPGKVPAGTMTSGPAELPDEGASDNMDSGYYNLFVVPDDAHINGGFRIPKTDALQDTEPDVFRNLRSLGEGECARIRCFPAIVATPNAEYGNTPEDGTAAYGFLNSIQVRENALLFGFSKLQDIPLKVLMDNADVFQIGKASAFNEFDRPHWAVKRVDIIKELRKRNVRVYVLS